MPSAPHELLVERRAFLAQSARVRWVGREIPADQAEDRRIPDLDRGPPPEATDPGDLSPVPLDQVNEELQGRALRDQILHEQHLGALTNESSEFRG